MFCKNCGNQLNEEASFCPKCGTKIGTASDIRTQDTSGYSENLIKPKKRKREKIIVLFFIALIAAVWVFQRQDDLNQAANVNKGKGADDPVTVAQTYMICIQYRDTSYIVKYLDEQLDNDTYISRLEENFAVLVADGVDKINMDGITYDVGETYKQFGNTYVDIDIHYSEQGRFGGNAVFGKNYKMTLILHRASTPDGEKWFLGKVPSSYHIDETGLL